MLQDRFFNSNHLQWHDYFWTSVHWSYFVIPHLAAIRIWYTNAPLFRRYLSAMTLLLGVGATIYFLMPSVPPWMAPEPFDTASDPLLIRVMKNIGEELGGGLYRASYRVIGESNPIAAMPSMHMAVTFLLVCPGFAVSKRWGIAALIYSGMMGYALVYLGEHYVIDVVVGCAIALYAWVAIGVWARRVAPALTGSGSASAGAAESRA
jgi:membrane-associated phospholipid phosphatase